MKKELLTILLCASPLLISPLASAQEKDGLGIGFKIGTTGGSIELSTALTQTINLRGAYNFAEFDFDVEDTDINYSSEFNKSSISLMLDWHPGDGGFRISGGVFSHSDNEISILAQPISGNYELNNTTYDATQIGSLDGGISFEKTTPYVGIGWGNAPKAGNGFGIVIDLGILIQDSPVISLAATGCNLGVAVCDQLNTDIQAEIAALDEDLEDLDFWPVINVGFSFQF